MREFNTGVAEHKRKANKPPSDNDDYQRMPRGSAPPVHETDTGRSIDFENVRVIRQGFSSGQERLCAEAIELAKAKNSPDRMDRMVISNAWLPLINSTNHPNGEEELKIN